MGDVHRAPELGQSRAGTTRVPLGMAHGAGTGRKQSAQHTSRPAKHVHTQPARPFPALVEA